MTTPERQHPRYAHEVEVTVRWGVNGSSKSTRGRTRNVSRGGLCANVDHAIAVGTDISLEITLVFDNETQSEALTLPARIAWCTVVDEDYQIGASFKPLNAERSELVQLFLKYLGEERDRGKQPRVQTSVDDRFG